MFAAMFRAAVRLSPYGAAGCGTVCVNLGRSGGGGTLGAAARPCRQKWCGTNSAAQCGGAAGSLVVGGGADNPVHLYAVAVAGAGVSAGAAGADGLEQRCDLADLTALRTQSACRSRPLSLLMGSGAP